MKTPSWKIAILFLLAVASVYYNNMPALYISVALLIRYDFQNWLLESRNG